MPRSSRSLLAATLATLVLAGTASVSTEAQAGPGARAFHGPRVGYVHVPRVGPGYYHGPRGHWHGGYYGWGGVALGVGLGALIVSRPWDPVIVERQTTYVYPEAQPVPPVAPPPVAAPVPRAADPIVYPSRGQSAQQTEADRQECNRWATTQPNAMADASVFQRAVAACLEGRGYTVK